MRHIIGNNRQMGGQIPERKFANGSRDELRVELTPKVSLLGSIAELIEAFGETNGIPDQQIFRVNLAVDELVTNYVLYSVHKVRDPRIELTLQVGEGKLIVTLLDTGPPFNPLEAPEPDLSDDLDKQKIGGLGLHLVRSYCDRMRHQVVDGCNRVTLEHDLPPGTPRVTGEPLQTQHPEVTDSARDDGDGPREGNGQGDNRS